MHSQYYPKHLLKFIKQNVTGSASEKKNREESMRAVLHVFNSPR